MQKAILSIFLFLSFACTRNRVGSIDSVKKNAADPVTVIVNLTKDKKFLFRYFDYFNNSQLASFDKTDTLRLNNKKRIVSYNFNGVSDLRYFPLSPGDTVSVSMVNGKMMLNSQNAVLDGKLALMNKLSFYVRSRSYTLKDDLTRGLKSIDNFSLSKRQIIDNFKTKINDSVLQIAYRTVDYDRLASVLAIYTQYNVKTDSVFTLLRQSDADSWDYLTFRNVLDYYINYLSKVYGANTSAEIFSYIDRQVPKAARDYAKFYYLSTYETGSKQKVDTLTIAVANFSRQAAHRELVTYLSQNLKNYINNLDTKNATSIMLSTSDGDNPVSFRSVLNKYKGSIIYLDFWASWCAPCIAEIPHSLSFSAKVPAVFLYFSADDNIVAWKNKTNELKIPPQRSFLFLKNKQLKDFVTKYAIKSIPRYMVIDKNGEIVNQDAPRPSDPALEKMLD